MRLPNAERAVVDIRKLRDYCLSADHPRGQHKARLFRSALGWTSDNSEDLHRSLLQAVQTQEAVFFGTDDYGQRYALDFLVQGTTGAATIRSLWIIRNGEDFPRLTSCYVL